MSSLRLAIKLSIAENKDSSVTVTKSRSDDEGLEIHAGRKRKMSLDSKEPRKKPTRDKSVSIDESDLSARNGSDQDDHEVILPTMVEDQDTQLSADSVIESREEFEAVETKVVTEAENLESKPENTSDQGCDIPEKMESDIPESFSVTEDVRELEVIEDDKKELDRQDSIELEGPEVTELESEQVGSQKKRKKRTPSILKDLQVLTTESLEEISNNVKDEDDATGARYQSARTAAKIAKSKFSGNKGKSGDGSKVSKKTPNSEKLSREVTPQELKTEWIQCDDCSKWRSIPPSAGIDLEALPEKWFCWMNSWDPDRNNCEAPEEQYQTFDNTFPGDGENPDFPTAENTTSLFKGRTKGKGRKTSVHDFNETPSKMDEIASSKEVTTGKKRGLNSKASIPRSVGMMAGVPVQAVSWVQCNKCKKWRKAPNVDDLPDKWFCSLNTWNPDYASCNVRQEEDDNANDSNLLVYQTPHKGGRRISQQQGNSSVAAGLSAEPAPAALATGNPVLKKTSWVQCERKGCKKWRKVPASIEIDSLPEKWYCEMNTWNPDSASCDAPEDVDSDVEKAEAEPRNHFILSGPKAPSALSYRRIIFGNDGKIKACFSDKNKNGYGLYSFYLPQRKSNPSFGSDNETVEPLKKVSYWWSSAYQTSQQPSSFSDPCSTPLLDAANRIYDCGTIKASPKFSYPQKTDPSWQIFQALPLLTRMKAECSLVRNCFVAANQTLLSLPNLMNILHTSQFIHPVLESCRKFSSHEAILNAIRRLEESDELEIAFNSSSEMVLSLLLPLSTLRTMVAARSKIFQAKESRPTFGTKWAKSGVPLKMRKFHVLRKTDNAELENDGDDNSNGNSSDDGDNEDAPPSSMSAGSEVQESTDLCGVVKP